MAKVTITITDLTNDRVKVECNPTFETMMAMDLSGNHLTSAHGYAFSIINHIREINNKASPIVRSIPKLVS